MVSGYLLDTNVISQFAPDRPELSAQLQQWLRERGAEDGLFVSAMTIAEIERGIRSLQRRGSTEKAQRLRHWLDGILLSFVDRVLPLDTEVALVTGQIEDEAAAQGRHPGLGDIIIAATAKYHRLTVVTENIRHFEPLGVTVRHPADLG